jgi:hypothetical protein
MTVSSKCLCCQAKQEVGRPKQCPVCGHVFQGKGWDGIDAHWRSKHEGVVQYDTFWKGLCEAHKT